MLGFTKLSYNGGATMWGQLLSRCTVCGELIGCWDCDDEGVPVAVVFDNEESHNCIDTKGD